MAKVQSAEGITKTFDPDSQDFRKLRNKWRNKEEFHIVSEIRDRYESEQKRGRETGCFFASPFNLIDPNDIPVGRNANAGTDWLDHWDMCDKKVWMWRMYLEGQANVKSPISFAPYNAFEAEFGESKFSAIVIPTEYDEDRYKAKVYEKIYRHWENESGVDSVNLATARESAARGTSFRHITYIRQTKEVELIQDSNAVTQEIYETLANGTLEEQEKMRKIIMEDRKPLTKKKTVVEYDDVAHIHIPNEEIYVDPDSWTLRGRYREASDLTWRSIVDVEEFRREMRNSADPYIIKDNIDRVCTAEESASDYDDERAFFTVPKDISGRHKVEILRYYNQATDKFYIIANDVLVRKGPLPFNHKRIPFATHRYMVKDDQFYGIGLPAMLESLQSEDEITRNSAIELMNINLHPDLFVNTDVFEDVDSQLTRIEGNNKVEVGGSVGPDNIRWFEGPQLRADWRAMRSDLEMDAIKISGINATAYSMPKPGEPVRNNLMSLESSLKMIKKGIRNWGFGYKEAILQTLEIMRQKYPVGIETEFGGGNKKIFSIAKEYADSGTEISEDIMAKPRKIRVQGKKLIEDGGTIREVDLEPEEGEYSTFSLKNEYLNLAGDLDVEIDMTQILPLSESQRAAKADQFVQTLIPILQNPQLLQNPAIQGVLRYYYDANGVSQEIQDTISDAPSDESIKRAVMQEKAMLSGDRVSGIPGEPLDHVNHHAMVLIELMTELAKIDTQNTTMEEFERIRSGVESMASHLEADRIQRSEADEMALATSKAITQPPQQQQMGANPQNMGSMQEMGGMNSGPAQEMAGMGENVPPQMMG